MSYSFKIPSAEVIESYLKSAEQLHSSLSHHGRHLIRLLIFYKLLVMRIT